MVLSFSWRGPRPGSEDHGLAVSTGYLRSLFCRQGRPPTEGERAYCRRADRRANGKGQMGCSARRSTCGACEWLTGRWPSSGSVTPSLRAAGVADGEICAEVFETSAGWGNHLIGF